MAAHEPPVAPAVSMFRVSDGSQAVSPSRASRQYRAGFMQRAGSRPSVPTAAHRALVAPMVRARLCSGLARGPVPGTYCTVVFESGRARSSSLWIVRFATSDCRSSYRIVETGASPRRHDKLRPPSGGLRCGHHNGFSQWFRKVAPFGAWPERSASVSGPRHDVRQPTQ